MQANLLIHYHMEQEKIKHIRRIKQRRMLEVLEMQNKLKRVNKKLENVFVFDVKYNNNILTFYDKKEDFTYDGSLREFVEELFVKVGIMNRRQVIEFITHLTFTITLK